MVEIHHTAFMGVILASYLAGFLTVLYILGTCS